MKDLTIEQLRLLRKVALGTQPSEDEVKMIEELYDDGMVVKQQYPLGGKYVISQHGWNQLPKRMGVV